MLYQGVMIVWNFHAWDLENQLLEEAADPSQPPIRANRACNTAEKVSM